MQRFPEPAFNIWRYAVHVLGSADARKIPRGWLILILAVFAWVVWAIVINLIWQFL